MKRIIASALAASALTVAIGWGTATVMAQDKLGIIMDRRDTMKAQGKALETARFYAEGRASQTEAEAAVAKLIDTTKGLVEKFPPGTGMAEFPGKSGAKPAIWSEWDKFKAAPQASVTQEEKLLAFIKAGDKQGVSTQVKATWDDGCQVCHIPYREKL
jgi:cytochrome c556